MYELSLESWNEKIIASLNALPGANPLTLSEIGSFVDDEGPARKALASACEKAPENIRNRLTQEYFAAGPLELLLSDSDVTEIVINGSDSIWCERQGNLTRVEDRFLSELSYRNFINRLGREAGIHASLDCPFADGKWRGCRVHLIIPPASGDQAVLTLRRHPENPWNLQMLENLKWASPQAMFELKKLISEKKSFLVVGGTGSGKTSVLNACLQTLPQTERCLTIEDTDELRLPNKASVKLLTRKDPQGHLRDIDQSELVKQALRMRPDRIIMGEIRGPEAKDLLMAFATGHTGCWGTLHAESARQALIRLEMLVQLGAPQWSLTAVRTLILLSVTAIVVVARGDQGVRRLDGIYTISSLEDVGFLLERKI
jgi:pilus assembly protein CpaF